MQVNMKYLIPLRTDSNLIARARTTIPLLSKRPKPAMQQTDHKRPRTQDEEIGKAELIIRWTRVLMKVLYLVIRIPVLALKLIMPSTQGLLGFMENNLDRMNVNELENLSMEVGNRIKEKNMEEYLASEAEIPTRRRSNSSASSSTSTAQNSRTSAGFEKIPEMNSDIDRARRARQAFKDLPFAWTQEQQSKPNPECNYMPATYDEYNTPLNVDYFNKKYRSLIGASPTCDCNQPCKLWMSHKAGPNFRRIFWRCPKEIGRQCDFFQWLSNQPFAAQDKPQQPVKELCSHPVTTKSGTNPFVIQEKCKICNAIIKKELTELGIQKQEEQQRQKKQHFTETTTDTNALFKEFMHWKETEKPTNEQTLFKEFMDWKEQEMREMGMPPRGPPPATRPSEPAGSTRPRRS